MQNRMPTIKDPRAAQLAKPAARARVFWYSSFVVITTLAEACFLASTVPIWS